MIELINDTSLEINLSFFESIVTALDVHTPLELLITSNEEIQILNKTYRQIDKPTDVLSFPYANQEALLGSIVISSEYVKNGAVDFNHSEADECALLFIHGMLHLLGYDHEKDNGVMREKEEQLIIRFNLPQSLIVRSSNT